MNILEECYTISEKSVNSDVARDLIHSRLKSSKEMNTKNQIADKPFSSEETFGNVLLALSEEPIDRISNDVFSKQVDVNEMPEGAAKYYLQALLTLRTGMNDEGRISAIDYLIKAHNYSPNDPRIKTLMLILQSL